MSGRGRGRGARAPPSGARLLLQRSAQEAGLDAGNLRSLQDITKPQLFPDFEWHSSGHEGHDPQQAAAAASSSTPATGPQATAASKRAAASNVYLINKSREMNHRFQESPFNVRPSQEVDVVRYNKRPRPLEPDAHVADHIGKTADPKYLPEELLPNKVAASALKVGEIGDDGLPKKAMTLDELAAEEQRKKAAGEDGEEGELSDTQELEEEDEKKKWQTTRRITMRVKMKVMVVAAAVEMRLSSRFDRWMEDALGPISSLSLSLPCDCRSKNQRPTETSPRHQKINRVEGRSNQ